MTPPRPLVAERYRLLEQLGSGGMGVVWLARDEMLRRDVAIKEVIPPEGLTPQERDELRLRTLREARAAARLNDANVVRIYDVVHDEQAPWIVMEYVPSRSLHQVITDDGPLPPERVATIGLAVLGALRAAHAAGVMHRDVKPGNVLLADTGRVVLTDFGLAVFEGGDGAVTRPGLILGSPQYISPERAREGTSGPESDMWSLGATLYAAVEGRSPYARTTTYATLTALATEEPDPPIRAGVMKPVLAALLRKDPRARAGAAETERLLQRAAAGEGRPWWSMPALPRPRRSREGHTGGTGSSSPTPVGAHVSPISADPGIAADVSPAPVSLLHAYGRPAPSPSPAPAPPPAPVVKSSSGSGDQLVPLRWVDDEADATVPRAQRRWWLVAGAATVVLVVAAVLLLSDTRDDAPPNAGPIGGVRTTAAPAKAGPASPTPTKSPVVLGSIGGDTIQAPNGFEWVERPDLGWRVALPIGWVEQDRTPGDPMVYFASNIVPGMRVGIATTSKPPTAGAVQSAEAQESARLKQNPFPNYEKLGIKPVKDYWGDCAEWQYTYDSSQGHMRVSSLGCRVRPDLGLTLYWECTTDMWVQPTAHNTYGIIYGSLQPKTG
ncbi:serine/threonine-protein kinase [Dactylosporangium sp. CS-033363]|uniref:serine/threonine-protein kinase n=1 Tax=Dactylosporangium sp. CS-033363 TaxID=3239935 RepID=UPI003D914EF1